MKKITTSILLFISLFTQMYAQHSADTPVHREVLATKKFNDLKEEEQDLLIAKLQEAYLTIHKKEINSVSMRIRLQEENPACEWTGKHEAVKSKFVKYYMLERSYVMKILEI